MATHFNMKREQIWRVIAELDSAQQLAVQLTWHLCDTSFPAAALRGWNPRRTDTLFLDKNEQKKKLDSLSQLQLLHLREIHVKTFSDIAVRVLEQCYCLPLPLRVVVSVCQSASSSPCWLKKDNTKFLPFFALNGSRFNLYNVWL